jgi:hypothetical protein
MADRVVYSVPQQMAGAYCDSAEKYSKLYQSSVADPESFWAKIALNFHWKEPWTKVCRFLARNNVFVRLLGETISCCGLRKPSGDL